MKKVVLAVDLGTSCIRAALYDQNGHCEGVVRREYPLHRPEPNAAEQDPGDWWNGLIGCLRDIRQLPADVQIEGLALSGQMHGTVLLDRTNEPLGPAIIWCDQRSGEDVRHLHRQIGKETYEAITGNPLAAGFQISTLAYLKRCHPECWHKISKVLLPKDYLIQRLTGEFVTEPTDAISTGLLDVGLKNSQPFGWSTLLLDHLGLNLDHFPVLKPSLKPGLTVSHTITAQTGLPEGLPILCLGGDAVLGAHAASVGSHANEAIGLISSGGQLLVLRDKPCPAPQSGLHLLPHIQPQAWFSMAAFLSAGLSLEWFASWASRVATGRPGIKAILEAAEKTVAGAEGLLFLPHIAGERTPWLDPDARGAFIGIAPNHHFGHFTRAILEGVAYSYRMGLELLESTGGPVTKLSLGGGGTRSPLWCQIFANVLQRPVQTIADIGETSLRGAACGAAAALGWDLQPWIPSVSNPYQPDPTCDGIYQPLYQRFQRLPPQLKGALSNCPPSNTSGV